MYFFIYLYLRMKNVVMQLIVFILIYLLPIEIIFFYYSLLFLALLNNPLENNDKIQVIMKILVINNFLNYL